MKRFIHIPKNGGMSLRRAQNLKGTFKISTEQDLITPQYYKDLANTMAHHNEHLATEHARWCDLNELAQQDYCFAITRNPWNRVASRYNFLMDIWTNNKGDIRTKSQYGPITFEEFLEQRHEDSKLPFFWHRAIRNWYTQKEYVVDANDNLKCDILRLETSDIEKYLNLSRPIVHRNTSNYVKNKDYWGLYNDKTTQIVADWYKADIDFFGYDFDGIATRNIYYT